MKNFCLSMLTVVTTLLFINCNNPQPTKDTGKTKNESEVPKEDAEETTSMQLTKDDAKRMIEEHYKGMHKTMTIEKTRKSNQDNSGFDPFVNAGLMTRTEGPLHTEYIEPWFVYIYKLTEEGKKYLIEEKGNWYTLKRYETGIGEITQIKDINGPVHSAMVYYSVVAKNVTPFSVAWEGTPIFKDGRAEFVKGEGGWRFDGFR